MSVFWAFALMMVAYWFFRSPLCRASSDALRGRGQPGAQALEHLDETVGHLAEEVGALRAEVAELAERVDFTERALTAVRRNAVGAGHET